MADERYPFLSQFLEKTPPKGGDKTDKTSKREELSVSSGKFGGICREEPSERILSCGECPWYAENPWTHYPELPAWCDWHFDHLEADNPACIGYRRGEVPERRERRKEHD